MKVLGSAIAVILAATLNPAIAQDMQQQNNPNPQIDYNRFATLTAEVGNYRSERLVNFDKFLRIAEQKNAIILDTRSRDSFDAGHIEGAVNLPFSDFTEDKLSELLGDNSRPILIYCNNNFSDNIFPIAVKSAPLALNIPTFINLYGYGYKNIYELNEVLSVKDEQVKWTGESSLDKFNFPILKSNVDAAPAS